MAIKDRLIHMLGGVTRADVYKMTTKLELELKRIVDKHDMQGAWEQLKQERKMRRYH